MLDRLDLDTDKPSDEELAKRFGYEDDYYSGGGAESDRIVFDILIYLRICWLVDEAQAKNLEYSG